MLRCEFSRLVIVSRGEPAVRVIHAVRELNHGRADPIRLIAVHAEAERDATFVRQADDHSTKRAVRMGSVTSVIDLASLRGFLIEAVRRGIHRAEHSEDPDDGAIIADEHAAEASAE